MKSEEEGREIKLEVHFHNFAWDDVIKAYRCILNWSTGDRCQEINEQSWGDWPNGIV